MKFKHVVPLITWVVPTVVISSIMFKLDAPLTPTQNIGFIALIVSACITYFVGVKLAMKKED